MFSRQVRKCSTLFLRVNIRHAIVNHTSGDSNAFTRLPWVSNWRSRIRHFNQKLSEILAAKQLEKCLRKSREPFNDVLARFQFACSHPACHFSYGLAETRSVVEHHEAFHP